MTDRDPPSSTAITGAIAAELIVVLGLFVTIGIHWNIIRLLIAAVWGQ